MSQIPSSFELEVFEKCIEELKMTNHIEKILTADVTYHHNIDFLDLR